MKNDYKNIKNFLHNDLGITKDYVENIIRDEVKKFLNNEQFIKNCVKDVIWNEINNDFVGKGSFYTIHDMTNIIKNDINSAICEEVKKKICISLRDE